MDRREFLAGTAVACTASYGLLSLGTSQAVGQDKRAPGRVVTVDAKPSSIQLDLNRTAVLVVDMQNDFGSKGGMFERAGIDISGIQSAVQPTAKVLAASRKAAIPIIYLKMGFHPDLSDMGHRDSPNWRAHNLMKVGMTVIGPDGAEGRILVRDTWNTQIVPALKAEPGDIQIYKSRFSGFYETDLHDTLKRLNIRDLIVTGCTTSVCVESTIRDAMFRDYSPVLLSDCTAEPIGEKFSRSNHEASLFLIQTMLGWTATSNEFVHALESSRNAL